MDKVKGLSELSPFFVVNPRLFGDREGFCKFPIIYKKLDIVDKVDKNTQYCVNFTFFT